jgi:hypothetical protein
MGFLASQHDEISKKLYREAIPSSRLAIKKLSDLRNQE